MTEKPINPNPDYQDKDIRVRPILIFMVGLTVVTILILGFLALFFNVMERQSRAADEQMPPEARERVLPPEPRLLVDEQMGLKEYLENARQITDYYAVLSDEYVRIPVEEAILLVAERGLPRWAADVVESPSPDDASIAQDVEAVD